MTNSVLENPSYKYWRMASQKLPQTLRNKIKDTTYPFFIELLKWLIIDLQRPRYFHPYGLYFYCGNVGTGKTMFMTITLDELRKKYGNQIYIGTNYGYIYEDFRIESLTDILTIRDKPTIIGYDEIQNDFGSRDWASLDQALSERITQNRKLHGLMILATAQQFGFVDKKLRKLTMLVYQCMTIFNRLTIARIFSPEVKEKLEGGQYITNDSKVSKGVKMKIQSDYYRNLYNSFQILDSMKNKLESNRIDAQKLAEKLITISRGDNL